jgi:hypothetical protein
MKITRSDREKLVIVDFPYVIGAILFLGALIMLGGLFKLLAQGGIQRNELIGHLLCFGLFFFGGVLLTKRSMFEFDLARRQLIWSRIGFFTRQGGTVPFGQITGATVQSIPGSGSGLSYRVALTTTQGDIPLTDAYGGGLEKACKAIRNAINLALGFPTLPENQTDEADLRALIGSGRVIDAIKLVRERRGCGLAEAKDIVDRMKAGVG